MKSAEVELQLDQLVLHANLGLPDTPKGVVAFAHGSGSSRHSPRNRFVARQLEAAGFATLLLDLLTLEEEQLDETTRQLRFDITLLAQRLERAVGWLSRQQSVAKLPVGLFGASTGAAAALVAAARLPEQVQAVVSRGGRPDLALQALPKVRAATLLIIGGADLEVIRLNQQAYEQLTCEKKIEIVPGAGHLFEESGVLEAVATLAIGWFEKHLRE
jgi:putative phosphoribosyl transferase